MSGVDYTSKSAVYNLINNTGGLNSTASGLNVKETESTDCQNIDFNKFGSLLKRNGYTTLNSAAVDYGGYDTNCKLLVHFDGADGSTDDYTASTGQTVALEGTAQLDTAQYVFGCSSLLLDGDSDFATVPDNANWDFDDGDFTLNCRVRFAALDGVQCLLSQYEDADNQWYLIKDDDEKVQLKFLDGGVAKGDYITTAAYGFEVDTWYDIQIQRNTTTCYLQIDGAVVALTETTAFSTNDVGDMAGKLKIGAVGADAAEANFLNGWIEEVRVVKGVAQSSVAFTIRNTAFNNGTGNAWTGLHWFERSANSTKQLVGVCGVSILRMDDLDGTWDDVTCEHSITEDADTHWSFTTANEIMIGTNGVDLPFKLSSTGGASSADVPANLTTAKFVEHWSNYTFLANVTVAAALYKSRIYWSNIDSTSTWTATDYREVGYKDGQEITGVKGLGDRLVIYKSRSIWIAQFTGDSDIPFVFTKTNSHVGAESGYSIQEVDNGHVFRSQDGYYYFDGLNSTKISDRISTTLDGFAEGRSQYVVSAYQKSKNKYWASESLTGESTHSKIITWDSYNNAFSVYEGLAANCFAMVYTSGSERVYFGDYSGFVYRADSGTDDYPLGVQTAIDAYYCTKWFNFSDLVNKKGVPHVTLYYQIATSTVSFAYSYDFDSSFNYSKNIYLGTSSAEWDLAIWDTSTFASSGGLVERIDLTGRGRVIRFRISNATLEETMQIDGFGMELYLETNA